MKISNRSPFDFGLSLIEEYYQLFFVNEFQFFVLFLLRREINSVCCFSSSSRYSSGIIMQGIRGACRRAGSVAQLLLGKQRNTFANPRWTRLAYQPTANFHSMFVVFSFRRE